MPTINLMTEYQPIIEQRYKLGSLVWGKAKTKYDFTGVATVKRLTPQTQELNNYNPDETTGPRFGAVREIEDVENTYTITQNKSFNMSIDSSYNTKQKMIKRSGAMLKMETDEVVIPTKDKYALSVYANTSGIQESIDGILTTDNVVSKIIAANVALVNEKVPEEDLLIWTGASNYGVMQLAKEFINLRGLGEKSVGKGVVGEMSGIRICRVPDSYMPDNVNFIAVDTRAIMNVDKHKLLRIITESENLDGALLQGHLMYDAFVVNQKKKGIYVSLKQARSV